MADAVRFVRPAEVVVDNSDLSGVTLTGSWTASSSAGFHGTNSPARWQYGKGEAKSVRFTPTLVETKNYEVYVWWTSHTNRATNVPIDVISSSGTATTQVNQQVDGGQWISLGVYPFAAGTSGSEPQCMKRRPAAALSPMPYGSCRGSRSRLLGAAPGNISSG